MPDVYSGFETHILEGGDPFFVGRLPENLLPNSRQFEALWALHPDDFPQIHLHGRLVRIPRWQQAYGSDYHFSGRTSTALPVPPALGPLHTWARASVDNRLNGMLLNWYDGSLGHYIGPHRDSTKGMVPAAPIVTISLGEGRIFRLTALGPDSKRACDFSADPGTVFILPQETNRRWKHGVPRFARHRGRRISITLRAFA